MTGIVTKVVYYGAFIDVDGVSGLLHISDVAWEQPRSIGESLTVGQSLDVLVLRVDAERGRISLGSKQLTPDPMIEFQQRYPSGSVLDGTVVDVQEASTLVRLSEQVLGVLPREPLLATARLEGAPAPAEIGSRIRVKVESWEAQTRSLYVSRVEDEPNL